MPTSASFDDQKIDGDFADVAGNRRAAPRTNAAVPVEIVLLSAEGAPTLRASTYETSTGGLSFISRRAFASGEPLAVAFRFLNGPSRMIRCQTSRCSAGASGQFVVGAEFLEVVTLPGRVVAIPAAWLAKGRGWKPKTVDTKDARGS